MTDRNGAGLRRGGAPPPPRCCGIADCDDDFWRTGRPPEPKPRLVFEKTVASARGRLAQERRRWRRGHPAGFDARPVPRGDGSSDLMEWEASVPGKGGTDWEGGAYRVKLRFPDGYPSDPPACAFVPPLFHPNVLPGGEICLAMLGEGWRPETTVAQILLGIQGMLDAPDVDAPGRREARDLFAADHAAYKRRAKAEARKNSPAS